MRRTLWYEILFIALMLGTVWHNLQQTLHVLIKNIVDACAYVLLKCLGLAFHFCATEVALYVACYLTVYCCQGEVIAHGAAYGSFLARVL